MSPPDMCVTPLSMMSSPTASSAAVDVNFLEYQVRFRCTPVQCSTRVTHRVGWWCAVQVAACHIPADAHGAHCRVAVTDTTLARCGMPTSCTAVASHRVAGTPVRGACVQVLTCCGSKDFELTRCVAAGQNGIVFAARCLRKGMPKPNKLFALKLVFNFGLSTAATRNTFENEFNVLSRLPPHNNITRFWTQFVDEVRGGRWCWR